METQRPPVRIRFKYNMDTGEVEEFIIDDNARSASETYHDKVAHAIASELDRNPEIMDGGGLTLDDVHISSESADMKEKKKRTITDGG